MNPPLPTSLQRLSLDIDDAIAQQMRVVAIVDPASCPGVWSRFGSMAAARRGGSLFSGTSHPTDERVAPLVLPLHIDDTSTLTALTSIAQAYPAVIWLASPDSLEALLPKLTAKLVAVLAEGGQPIMLRYYDPRTLPALLRLLDDNQRNQLNDGVRTWWWFDRGNILRREDNLEGVADTPFNAPEIALRPKQVDQLPHDSFIDRVLKVLTADNSTTLHGFDRAQRYELAERLVADAGQWGIDSEYECACYIAVALEQGASFARRSDWEKPMSEVKTGTTRFSDAVTMWSEQNEDQ